MYNAAAPHAIYPSKDANESTPMTNLNAFLFEDDIEMFDLQALNQVVFDDPYSSLETLIHQSSSEHVPVFGDFAAGFTFGKESIPKNFPIFLQMQRNKERMPHLIENETLAFSSGRVDGSGYASAFKPTSTPLTRQRTFDKDEQLQKRRERNKVFARRTRLRKKYMFQSLRSQVMDLYKENLRLKEIIRKRCGEKSRLILHRTNPDVMPSIVASCVEQATMLIQKSDFLLMQALQASQPSFCIANAQLPDCPIVFASEKFIEITGYTASQVLGRNCRFLQGPETDSAAVLKLREGMKEGRDIDVVLLNYNASGECFWNHVLISGVRDADGNVRYFVGIQHIVNKKVDVDKVSNVVDDLE
mmetsp:Transcript_13264/g.18692  ORF Transcript_13264/g.18692 Transcript_13264/m.18692 type:complete len:359 (-) Transcript_13264:54-1130(-)|eukprot:CAMPEP_0171452866 /NCGR_PEP_ID=MMETSP0945-20130129/802_1 /TAXON_ID=109269 /ORGANISM="Vaucheria litorea, Strain CCMP2940" /LENGTH=358 /DNA_ID=CAMNT_0011977617 /DNA_START=18 /DNA_END=1094 /DNA_ORIENTATION=-